MTINGNIEDDIIIFSGETLLSDSGTVGGDLTSSSGNIKLLGNIGGNVSGSAGEVILGGNIGKNVDLNTGSITILPDAHIAGDLEYRSPEKQQFPKVPWEKK
ncbi:MAG: hypothetical protein R2741_01435 [Methanolobus sp.]